MLCFGATLAAAADRRGVSNASGNAERKAYYGDLHLVSSYGFASYRSPIDPDAAYRFARGEALDIDGTVIRRASPPLDFLAVTDYGENLGLFNTLDDPNSAFSQTEIGRALRTGDPSVQRRIIDLMLVGRQQPYLGVAPDTAKTIAAATWQRSIEAANRHYQPGNFTTFIAYHWTVKTGGHDFDRVVLFSGASAPLPFTSFDSNKPEDLWTYLEQVRKQGQDVLAIPHNPNLSNGLKFDWVDSEGKSIDRTYAARRLLNEPLVEIANIGAAETHPRLSPRDPFASFELFGLEQMTKPEGSYVRHALGRGLQIARHTGVNPYAFGFVGSTDFHGLSDGAEDAYPSLNRPLSPIRAAKPGVADILYPELQMAPVTPGSGSLTGVWAEQNSRESIFAALRRRETFATSGTRLKLRFFGGWDYGRGLLKRRAWIEEAYRGGVPMGGTLPAMPRGKKAPRFAIEAVADPHGANLDRVQVIRVRLENGKAVEKIFDVALSGGRQVDVKTGEAPAVGNTVDLQSATYTNTIGAPQISVMWEDPEFDPHAPAVYYLRAIEIPTPRWTTIAAVKRGQPVPEDVPATIQERGWSSPIWFSAPAQTGKEKR